MNNLVKQVEEKDINEVKEFVDETLKVTKQHIDNPDESVRYYPTLKLTTLEVPATLILSMIKLLDHYQEQPKLSIPKKIAEEVEKVNRNRYTGAEEFSDVVYDWLYDPKFLGISEVSEEEYKKTGWVYSQTDRHEMNKLRNKRENIIRAYLACKSLGVELVEVEG